jgi:putative inorganic carbon (HCO3(-)) transporter
MPFRIVVVLIIEIAGAVGAAGYPYLGLLALLFVTFGRPQDDRPNVTDLHIPMILVISITVGMLMRLSSSAPAVLAAIKRLKIILVLYALMVISALNNWTELSKSRLYDFTTVIFLCVLTLALVTTEKRLRGYIAMLLVSGAYVVIGVIRNPSHIVEEIGGEQFERMAIAKGGTLFGNSNYLALFMVLTIFLSLTLMAFYRSVWQRAILLSLAGGAGYVFFRANSRGASFALAIGLLFLWFISKARIKNAVLGLVLVGCGSLLAPQSYWDRLNTVAHYEEDRSATDRLDLWQIALKLIGEHPVLGVGPDNFTLYAPNSPHDAYLQIASEVGVPALLVYITTLLAGLCAVWRVRRFSTREPQSFSYYDAAYKGTFCCLLAIVIQGFTTGLAHREFVYALVTLSFCVEGLAEKAQAVTIDSAPVGPAPLEPTFESIAEPWGVLRLR